MSYIRWFNEITLDDIPLVGGKNASLGELYRLLQNDRCKLPEGFAITVDAYWNLVNSNGLSETIAQTLAKLDISDTQALQHAGNSIRRSILQTPLPKLVNVDRFQTFAPDPDTGPNSF